MKNANTGRLCALLRNVKKGFTLVELLVVVLIIGILAATALPQYEKAVIKSRMTEVQTVGNSLKKAEQLYYLANGTYARDLEDLDVTLNCSLDKMGGGEKKYLCKNFDLSIQGDADIDAHFWIRSMPEQAWQWNFYFQRETECVAYTSSKIDVIRSVCQSVTGDDNPRVISGSYYYKMK